MVRCGSVLSSTGITSAGGAGRAARLIQAGLLRVVSATWAASLPASSTRLSIDARQTLAVPVSAVLSDEQGAYLFVVAEQHAHRLAVRLGHEEHDYVEGAGAWSAGQRVVISGNYELADGMAVREVAP